MGDGKDPGHVPRVSVHVSFFIISFSFRQLEHTVGSNTLNEQKHRTPQIEKHKNK